jgi:hypothetical protein
MIPEILEKVVIEAAPEAMVESAPESYSDCYSPVEWKSLIEDLKELPTFKLKVKSSPGDALRYSYALEGKQEGSMHDYEDRILFIITDEGVHVENQSYRDSMLDDVFRCLFEEPLNRMPLYINDKRPVVKKVANWRLRCAV